MSHLEPLVVNHAGHIRSLEDAIRENAACQRATRRCLVLLEEEATTLTEQLIRYLVLLEEEATTLTEQLILARDEAEAH